MKRIFIIFIIFTSSAFFIFPNDIKFPGKIGLEYKIQFFSDIIDGKPKESIDAVSGALFIGNEFKGKVKFKPVKFYSVTPWLMDKIEMKWDPSKNETQPFLKLRNRFYFGLDNFFVIPEALSIGINYELRLENSIQYNQIEVRHTPILYLKGEYNFGLSFKIKNMFEFYLYPVDYIGPSENRMFSKFCYELDSLNIQFEFFHFFSPTKKIQGSIEADLFISAQYLVGLKRYEAVLDKKPLYKLSKVELFLGVNFDFWGIKPFVGFFAIWNQYSSANGGRVDDFAETIGILDSRPYAPGLYTQFFPGIRCGIDLVKGNLELNFEYTGYIISYDSYDYSSNFNDNTDYSLQELMDNSLIQIYRLWENHISCYAKFKI